MSQLDLFSNAPASPPVTTLNVECFEPSPCSASALVGAASSVLVPHVPECPFEAYALADDDKAWDPRRMVRFPRVTSFAELFVEALSENRIIQPVLWEDETISPFCSVSGADDFRVLYVRPAAAVVDLIKETMILTGHGVHFHVAERDDGTALVLAKYQQIIGSLWLAIVDPATVRASEPAKAPAPAQASAPTSAMLDSPPTWDRALTDMLDRANARASDDLDELKSTLAKLNGCTVEELDEREAEAKRKKASEKARRRAERPATGRRAATATPPPRKAQRSLDEEPAAAPTRRLDARQQELLSLVAVEGNRAVYTRDEPVPDWKALKLVVETLGGVWRTGGKKRRGGWDFAEEVDAAEVIRLAQESGEILDLRRLAQESGEILDLRATGFFPTPDAIAEELVQLAQIPPGAVVLEPSAGTGRIALAVRRLHPDARVLCCELLEPNRVELTRLGFELVGEDFLALDPQSLPEIAVCAMNPPFAKFAEVDHVEHALRCVRHGGRVASIMSAAIKYRDAGPYTRLRGLIESSGGTIEDCPPGSFLESGTGVSTVKVTLRRVA